MSRSEVEIDDLNEPYVPEVFQLSGCLILTFTHHRDRTKHKIFRELLNMCPLLHERLFDMLRTEDELEFVADMVCRSYDTSADTPPDKVPSFLRELIVLALTT